MVGQDINIHSPYQPLLPRSTFFKYLLTAHATLRSGIPTTEKTTPKVFRTQRSTVTLPQQILTPRQGLISKSTQRICSKGLLAGFFWNQTQPLLHPVSSLEPMTWAVSKYLPTFSTHILPRSGGRNYHLESLRDECEDFVLWGGFNIWMYVDIYVDICKCGFYVIFWCILMMWKKSEQI